LDATGTIEGIKLDAAHTISSPIVLTQIVSDGIVGEPASAIVLTDEVARTLVVVGVVVL